MFKSWKIELFDWFLSCRLGKHLYDQLAYLHMKCKYTDDDMVKGYILEAFKKILFIICIYLECSNDSKINILKIYYLSMQITHSASKAVGFLTKRQKSNASF